MVEEAVDLRAAEILLFVICFNVSIPLVAATGIFGAGPSGTSILNEYLVWGVAASALTVGGISVMGWSFKVPAVITVFASVYGASVAALDVLILQIIQPHDVALVFAGAITFVCTVVGVLGILQIAGGAFGPMD